jgi:hypothetical protein
VSNQRKDLQIIDKKVLLFVIMYFLIITFLEYQANKQTLPNWCQSRCQQEEINRPWNTSAVFHCYGSWHGDGHG